MRDIKSLREESLNDILADGGQEFTNRINSQDDFDQAVRRMLFWLGSAGLPD